MGKPRRPAAQRQISHTHSLCDRNIHSRAPAQPPVHPRHRTRDILPSVEGHRRHRLARRPRSLRHSGGTDTLRTCAGIHRSVPILRALLCQHPGLQLQRRRACLCHPRSGIVHMGHTRALQPDERQAHTLERGSEHPALRHTLHRQQHVDPRSDNGRGHRLSVLGQEDPREDTQPCGDEHLRDIHRLFELRASAHKVDGQSADEPERPRQCVRARILPQP